MDSRRTKLELMGIFQPTVPFDARLHVDGGDGWRSLLCGEHRPQDFGEDAGGQPLPDKSEFKQYVWENELHNDCVHADPCTAVSKLSVQGSG